MSNAVKLSLEQRILDFIYSHRLIEQDTCLLVALSGGPDSMCMLDVLLKLRGELRIQLHIAHLNHQLRGSDSDSDARFIDRLARQLGIPATLATGDVTGYRREKHLSLEEAAREVRYAFLAEAAYSLGTDRVAVGHTSSDNIETVIMHLVRGTGTAGLVGLKPLVKQRSAGSELTVVRPLLSVSRAETAEYCREHKLAVRIDSSNLALSSMRNRIRHELLPILTTYNPGIEQAILRLSRIASDDIDFLAIEGKKLWRRIVHIHQGIILLDRKEFLEIHPALKRYLLRMACNKLLGNLKDIETRHIEMIIDSLEKPAGKILNLPRGLKFLIDYQRYLLGKDPESLSPLPPLNGIWQLNIPGQSTLPGWMVKAEFLDRKQVKMERDNPFCAFLDLDSAGNRLLVRTRRSADRFQPLGMDKQKKLGKFMIDARIPAAWRNYIPLVCCDDQILWVVGWRINDRYRVTKKTKRILNLEFEKTGQESNSFNELS